MDIGEINVREFPLKPGDDDAFSDVKFGWLSISELSSAIHQRKTKWHETAWFALFIMFYYFKEVLNSAVYFLFQA